MMAPKTVTVSVRYAKPGTQPPLYLGGSFDDPQWHEPREMQYTTDEHNEHSFYTQVEVTEGKEYQYKFRVGLGDWWVLNEHSPTVADDQGFRNNLLAVPVAEHTTTTTTTTTAPNPTAETPRPANPARAPDMEPASPEHAEEAMGTRETSDVLFDDEIVKHVEPMQDDPNRPIRDAAEADVITDPQEGKMAPPHAVPEPVEPTPTPAPGPETGSSEGRKETKQDSGAIDPEPRAPHPAPALELDQADRELMEGWEGAKDNDETAASAIETSQTGPASPPANASTRENPRSPTLQADHTYAQHTEDGPASDDVGDGVEASHSVPTLVVEKMDATPSFGDDFGPGATVAEQDAHKLRALDAEPDRTIVRHGARTPEIADVAAEVADSAATLDRDAPTPPISDEEAGRIGYRRMSTTPISEVAATADEVADVAARIDHTPLSAPEVKAYAYVDGKPMSQKDFGDLLETRGYFDIMNDESIQFAETPPDEKVPLFPHEAGTSAPISRSARRRQSSEARSRRSSRLPESAVYDPDDPTMILFPQDREGMLREIAKIQARMAPDTSDCVGPDAPILEEIHCPGKIVAPAYRPDQRSASLDLITEENDEEQEDLVEAPATNGRHGSRPLSKVEETDRKTTKIHTGNLIKAKNDTAASEPSPTKGENAKPEPEQKTAAEVPVTPAPEILTSPSTDHVDRSLEGSFDGAEGSQGLPLPVSPEQIPATPFVVGNRQLGHDDDEVQAITTLGGPNILVEPATPKVSIAMPNPMDRGVDDPETEPSGPSQDRRVATAKTTATDTKNIHASLRSRKQAPLSSPERPVTPSSLRSTRKDAKSRNFLKVFWRAVFVEWIGGLIVRFCGGNRRK